jgi:TPR repeat protein
MNLIKSPVVLVLASLLASGCASYDHSLFSSRAERGDCNGASNELTKGISAGDVSAISNMGWLYEVCYKNRDQAIGYYKLAARKGSDYARTQLVRLGQPIPPPDLTDDDNVRVRVRTQ